MFSSAAVTNTVSTMPEEMQNRTDNVGLEPTDIPDERSVEASNTMFSSSTLLEHAPAFEEDQNTFVRMETDSPLPTLHIPAHRISKENKPTIPSPGHKP